MFIWLWYIELVGDTIINCLIIGKVLRIIHVFKYTGYKFDRKSNESKNSLFRYSLPKI